MNQAQMKAALAKVSPKSKTTAVEAKRPWSEVVASVLGAVKPVVHQNVNTFTGAFSTSYQYHEAKRKGLL